MKNKVYIDFDFGGVYWSIEDVKRNANLLKRIMQGIDNSIMVKLANNKISIDEVINMVFEDEDLEGYRIVETDSDVVFVDWDIDNAFSSAEEMIETFDKLDILKYVAELYHWDLEKLFSAIQNKKITLEQIYIDYIRAMDDASICEKNKTNE